MKLTIFTPTYNRAYIINNLYESLKRQTNKDFEWLVIDDGSTDNTSQVFDEILKNTDLNIRYYKKENGGKHTADNFALKKAKGELFFVVDSDDYLSDNAVERIDYYYSQIKDDDNFCGVCGLKAYFNNQIIGGPVNYDILDCTLLDYRYKYKIPGDKADVFKTALLRQYTYPEFEGEKFCPQPMTWNNVAKDHKTRFFAESIYFAEYLNDGISLNLLNARKNSPNSCMQYYAELANLKIPLTSKIKAAVSYYRFAYYTNTSLITKIKKLGFIKSFITIIPGTVLYLFDSSAFLHNLFLKPNKKLLKKQLENK